MHTESLKFGILRYLEYLKNLTISANIKVDCLEHNALLSEVKYKQIFRILVVV